MKTAGQYVRCQHIENNAVSLSYRLDVTTIYLYDCIQRLFIQTCRWTKLSEEL